MSDDQTQAPEGVTRWRKRPVEIDARLFDPGTDYDEACAVVAWCGGVATDHGCEISTLEGTMLATPGDYVIKGVSGEFYPCKPDIFAKTYEPASSAPGTVSVPTHSLRILLRLHQHLFDAGDLTETELSAFARLSAAAGTGES